MNQAKRKNPSQRTKHYIINRKPQTLEQARYPRHVFNPGVIDYQTFCTLAITSLHNDEPKFNCSIHIQIIFYFSIPKGRKPTTKINDEHLSRPYIEKLLPLILPLLKQHLFGPTANITSIDVKKLYGKVPMTYIIIKEVS